MSSSAAESEECAECGGTGYADDPSACGDPEHCSPYQPCPRGCTPDDEAVSDEFRQATAGFMEHNDGLMRRLAN